MKNRFNILLLVAGLAAPLMAQQAPGVMGERDIAQEDKVAKSFETIRADLKFQKLSRIKHRGSLEQRVCTIALAGIPPKHPVMGGSAVYRTSRPELISTELNRVASIDVHPKNNLGYHRYSVAVWRTSDLQTKENMYWVGIELFWSAPMEFIDYHFTDDISYHNDWKKLVAPECRGK